MIGYIRKLDLDGSIRIREYDSAHSPTLFDGGFKDDIKINLIKAFSENMPIDFDVQDGKISKIRTVKFSY